MLQQETDSLYKYRTYWGEESQAPNMKNFSLQLQNRSPGISMESVSGLHCLLKDVLKDFWLV